VAAPLAPTTAARSGIVVTNAYVIAQGPTEATAYFSITNQSSAPDFLTTISADEVAHDATLYLTGQEITTGTLTVGPGSTDTLAPGGQHVKLGLHGPLTRHQAVTLSLNFSRAGVVDVRALVR